MRKYWLTSGALFVGCVGLSFLHWNALGAALFAAPVAVQLVHRRVDRAMGLIALAALAGLLCGGSLGAALAYALVASLGCLLGIGILQHWTYGWTVAAVTALAYAIIVGHIVLQWDAWIAGTQAMYGEWVADFQKQLADGGANDSVKAMLNLMNWLHDHGQDIALGFWMGPVLIGACIAVAVMARRIQRQYGIEGLRGSFRAMRTSEWLVWAAIAVAVLCLIDYRWPGTLHRVVVWNAAVALALIYWVNGLSICVYAVDALRPSPLLVVLGIVMFVWLGMQPVLCFVGLFDTWSNFRAVVDRIVVARKQREQSGDKEE